MIIVDGNSHAPSSVRILYTPGFGDVDESVIRSLEIELVGVINGAEAMVGADDAIEVEQSIWAAYATDTAEVAGNAAVPVLLDECPRQDFGKGVVTLIAQQRPWHRPMGRKKDIELTVTVIVEHRALTLSSGPAFCPESSVLR